MIKFLKEEKKLLKESFTSYYNEYNTKRLEIIKKNVNCIDNTNSINRNPHFVWRWLNYLKDNSTLSNYFSLWIKIPNLSYKDVWELLKLKTDFLYLITTLEAKSILYKLENLDKFIDFQKKNIKILEDLFKDFGFDNKEEKSPLEEEKNYYISDKLKLKRLLEISYNILYDKLNVWVLCKWLWLKEKFKEKVYITPSEKTSKFIQFCKHFSSFVHYEWFHQEYWFELNIKDFIKYNTYIFEQKFYKKFFDTPKEEQAEILLWHFNIYSLENLEKDYTSFKNNYNKIKEETSESMPQIEEEINILEKNIKDFKKKKEKWQTNIIVKDNKYAFDWLILKEDIQYLKEMLIELFINNNSILLEKINFDTKDIKNIKLLLELNYKI